MSIVIDFPNQASRRRFSRLHDIMERSITWVFPGLLLFYLFSSSISRFLVFDRRIRIAQQIDEFLFIAIMVTIGIWVIASGRIYLHKFMFGVVLFAIWGSFTTLIHRVDLDVALLGFFQAMKPLLILIVFQSIPLEGKYLQRFEKRMDSLFVVLPVAAVAYSLVFDFLLKTNPMPAVREDLPLRLGISPARSFLTHPGPFGTVMVFTALYLFSRWLINRERKYILPFLAALLGILLTVRITPMLFLPVSLIAIYGAYQFGLHRVTRGVKRILAISIITVVLLGLVLTVLLWDVLSARFSLEEPQPRFSLLLNALRIQADTATLGVGFGMYGSPISISYHYSPYYYRYEIANLERKHTEESIDYLVLEKGQFLLQDGRRIEVDKAEIQAVLEAKPENPWQQIRFEEAFNQIPILILQIQSFNDGSWVKTRVRNLNRSGFEVALEVGENMLKAHEPEVIGWLAVEPSQFTWTGLPFEAGSLTTTERDQVAQIQFASPFTHPPGLVASLVSYEDPDPAGLRLVRKRTDYVSIRIEEDTTLDDETDHGRELLAFLAFGGQGLLTGRQIGPGSGTGSAEGVIGETGMLNRVVNHHYFTVDFNKRYDDPVVLATPPGYRGTDPAISRIVDIQSGSFTIFVQEQPVSSGPSRGYTSYLTDQWWSWYLGETGVWGFSIFVGTLLWVAKAMIGIIRKTYTHDAWIASMALMSSGLIVYCLVIGFAASTLSGPPGSYWTFGIAGLSLALGRINHE